MLRRIPIIVTMLVASAAWPALAAEPGPGWVSLFNGKDLSGWKVPEGDNGHWRVIDGAIDYDARSEAKGEKHLYSEKSYGDFELLIDFRLMRVPGDYPVPETLPDGSPKLDDKGQPVTTPLLGVDSGIYLRGVPKAQLNMWCSPLGSGEIHGYLVDAKMPEEVRAAAKPKLRADKPVGQWNTFHAKLQGESLEVSLNDKKIITGMRLVDLPASGPLVLQHHGGWNAKKNAYQPMSSVIQFRNIYLKPLGGDK